MPRTKKESSSSGAKCPGGRSYGCKQEEHEYGKVADIYCDRCKTRMGCSFCCQIPRELLCLNCKDWAKQAGIDAHGHIVGMNRAEAEVKKMIENPPF